MERIRVILTHGLMACARAWGGDVLPEHIDPWWPSRKRRKRMTDVEVAEKILACFGVKME